MKFYDNHATVPLNTLVWCVPKHRPHGGEKPKITTVFCRSDRAERQVSGGHPARMYLFGDTIETPTVERMP